MTPKLGLNVSTSKRYITCDNSNLSMFLFGFQKKGFYKNFEAEIWLSWNSGGARQISTIGYIEFNLPPPAPKVIEYDVHNKRPKS